MISYLLVAGAALMLAIGHAAPVRLRTTVETAPRALRTDTTAAAARSLFGALAGDWSCQGAFANGRPLASRLRFTPTLDARALSYEHRDAAPSTFVHKATWLLDASSHRMVSLAAAGTQGTGDLTASLFSAQLWTATSVTLTADTLVVAPWAPNRFTYTLPGADSLHMVWEVERGGSWRMGDYLDCRRDR